MTKFPKAIVLFALECAAVAALIAWGVLALIK